MTMHARFKEVQKVAGVPDSFFGALFFAFAAIAPVPSGFSGGASCSRSYYPGLPGSCTWKLFTGRSEVQAVPEPHDQCFGIERFAVTCSVSPGEGVLAPSPRRGRKTRRTEKRRREVKRFLEERDQGTYSKQN